MDGSAMAAVSTPAMATSITGPKMSIFCLFLKQNRHKIGGYEEEVCLLGDAISGDSISGDLISGDSISGVYTWTVYNCIHLDLRILTRTGVN